MKLLCRITNVLGTPDKQQRDPARLVGVGAVVIPLLVVGIYGLSASWNAAVAQEREGTRSAEAERGTSHSAEDDRDGAAADALRGFNPQTEREAALLQMIVQLQRELAALRREVQSRNGDDRPVSESRDGAGPRGDARGDGHQFALPARWQNTKEGRVFQAYDKNGDLIVSLDEWLGMTNGNISPARRETQTKRFNEAEPSGDGKFTPAEFIYWYSRGRFEGVQRGSRDGVGEKTGPRDGEGDRQGPREGDRE